MITKTVERLLRLAQGEQKTTTPTAVATHAEPKRGDPRKSRAALGDDQQREANAASEILEAISPHHDQVAPAHQHATATEDEPSRVQRAAVQHALASRHAAPAPAAGDDTVRLARSANRRSYSAVTISTFAITVAIIAALSVIVLIYHHLQSH